MVALSSQQVDDLFIVVVFNTKAKTAAKIDFLLCFGGALKLRPPFFHRLCLNNKHYYKEHCNDASQTVRVYES